MRSRAVAAVTALASAVALTVSVGGAPALGFGGDGLRTAANQYRVDGGLAPVSGTALLDEIATVRASQMATANVLEHNMQYIADRFAQAGVCWTGYGEIIAWISGGSYSYDHTLQQWWNSAQHHAIIMTAAYNAAGGAWDTASDGGHYSVMIFATLCGDSLPSGDASLGAPFTDVSGSIFRDDIAWLYDSGITSGCTATTFCPGATVSRGQMAAFLDRALGLPEATRDYFSDDNGSLFEGDINRLAAAGITTGCAPGRFCPDASVTRGEMASFLVRARRLTVGATLNYFDDDNGLPYEGDINRLAYDGVTTGCADRRYCPAGSVTRGQMAAFLRRAFGS